MTLSNSQSSSGSNNNNTNILIHRTSSNISRTCSNSSGGARRNNSDRGQNSKPISSQYYNKTASELDRSARGSTMPIASSACNSYSSTDMNSIEAPLSDSHTKSRDSYLDERLTKPTPDVVDTSIHRRESTSITRRYTRSALYLIRNEARSRCRPKCASKLQLLCIWKANNNSNYLSSSQQNGGNNINSSTQSNSMDVSSLSSPRMNSMTRQQSNHDLLYSGNSAGGNSSHHSSQKTYLDQRSISSSHLMPAFAKRRIGNFIHAICGNSTTGGGGGTSSSGAVGGGSTGGGSVSLSTSNDSIKYTNVSGKNNDHKQFSSPQRKNTHTNPTSKSVQNSTNNMVDSERDHERDKEYDRERGRDRERERDVNLNSSAGSSANARERRIGSGRLLPRDVNWDYHSEKESKDSASTSSGSMPFEKDLSSHLSAGGIGGNQRAGGGNQSSRFDYSHRSPVSKDRNSGAGVNIGGKNSADYRSDLRYENRRPFTRGDYERDNRGDNSNYVRRFMSDLINQNSNNFGGKSGSGISGGINHNENRRRNIRNDEPEWFSSGPTSQHDTIELRGFDEVDDSQSNSSGSVRGEGKRHRGSAAKQNNRRSRGNASQVEGSFAIENETNDVINIHDKTNAGDKEKLSSLATRRTPSPKVAATDPTSDTNNNSKDDSMSEEKKSDDKEISSGRIKNDDLMEDGTERDINKDMASGISFVTDQGEDKTTPFNFDAFLNVDPSNLLISEPNSGDTEVGSRFSRWFGNQNESQKSGNNEIHESPGQSVIEDNMVPLMLAESQIMKNEREACESANTNQSNTLMEFLQRGKINTAAGNMEPIANVGSIPSVEELEARMRKLGDDGNSLNRDQSMSNGFDNVNNPLNQFLNNSVLHQQQQQRQKHMQQFMMKQEVQTAPAQNSLTQQPQHLQINPVLHNAHLSASQTQDMEAFKKLLEQITPTTSMSSAKLANQNIPQLVPAPQQQQQIQRLPSIPSQQINILTTIGTMPPQNPAQLMKNDELTKFIQQQQLHQRRPQHLISGPPQHQQINQTISNDIPIVQTMFLAPQQRLEAQLLLQGISRGEVSQTTLGHQLNNPNTSPRTKEVLAAVLRETSRDTSPNVIMSGPQIMSPVLGQSHCNPNIPQPPPPIIIPSPQQISFNHPSQAGPQQQHPSTGSNTGCLPQRIPSPRELQYHTQSIMQNALIKKKLEEQQENFRRRQEIQKQQMQQHKPQQSPSHVEINEFNPLVGPPQQQQYAPKKGSQQQQQQQILPNQQPRHVNSPTPLAFTPTSVLRKMTAEKDSVNSFTNSSTAANTTTASTTGSANTTPLMASTTTVASNPGASNPNPNKPMHPLLMHYQQQHQTTSQNQPRMILGVGSHSQQQQQQGVAILSGPQIQPQQQHTDSARINSALRSNPIKWTGTIMNQVSLNKPMGRPILKGNITQSMPPPASGLNPLHQSQQTHPQPPQMTFASKIEFQQIQQQRVSNNQQTPGHPQQKPQPPTQQQQQQPQQQQSMPPSQQQSQNILMTQLYQQRAAIQRAQHFQFHQIHQQQQQQQHQQQQQLQQQQMNIIQNNGNRTVEQRINASQNVSNCANIINYQRDGGLSPTSNQLARWFSPELLAQASEGKLPPLNMNQVLSLEEFEKSIQHSSTAVNN